ncbi:MAG: cell division protein ZapA [Rhodothalassiaceae bacterium]
MGELTLRINDHPYTLACRDGDEAKLVALAAMVDDKITQLTGRVGQIGETRLMLMAALLLADELNELKEDRGVVSAEEAADLVDTAAVQVERIVEQLKAAS